MARSVCGAEPTPLACRQLRHVRDGGTTSRSADTVIATLAEVEKKIERTALVVIALGRLSPKEIERGETQSMRRTLTTYTHATDFGDEYMRQRTRLISLLALERELMKEKEPTL
jgi:hypothetical protein